MKFEVKQNSGFCEVGDFCGRAAHIAGRTSEDCGGGWWVAGMWWRAGSGGMPRGTQECRWCPGTEWCLETAVKHWSNFQKWSITLPGKTHAQCRGFHHVILQLKKNHMKATHQQTYQNGQKPEHCPYPMLAGKWGSFIQESSFIAGFHAKWCSHFGRRSVLKQLNVLLPFSPTVLLLDVCSKELKAYIHVKTYTWLFIAALFLSSQTWNKLRCPLVGEWHCGASWWQNIIYY